jgi:hypothetical protein
MINMEDGQDYLAPNKEMGDEDHNWGSTSDDEGNPMCGQRPPSYKLLEHEQVRRALEQRQLHPIQQGDPNTASSRRSQGRPQSTLLTQVQNH